MRTLCFFAILAMATLLPSLALAYDVLVLQSTRDPAYEEVLKGFNSVQKVSKRVIVLSDYAEVDVVRIAREDQPSLILTIGDAALKATHKIYNTPVVAVMSLGIHDLKILRSNLTSITMLAPPERFIKIFQTMKTRRVGVIYNPAKSGWYLKFARQAAEAVGIELVTREVSESRATIALLSALAKKVDALWMLPDCTAVTRETLEAYFRFGQQHTVPVVSFAASYLGLGAAVVLEINRIDLGRQAGAMVAARLGGDEIENMTPEFPKSVVLKTNRTVLKHLDPSLAAE
jgi:putative ABC transport system substrate-binding protein